MVYLIVVYDMEENRTRYPRVLLRQNLKHVQNSVFEGEVKEGDYVRIKKKLEEEVKNSESCIIYKLESGNILDRESIGEDPMDENRFI